MAIALQTNTAALNAERRLANSSLELSQAFTRLSSGLRINRAGDDAAGFAVSSLLNADARVYAQAIRNLNDGLSYMNIAEGAASELKTILFRVREIATQSSNGTYSDSERAALDAEVQELQEEYSRILDTTSFNGRPILVGETAVTLQLGYGAVESLSVVLGAQQAIGAVGNGTFLATVSYAGGNGHQSVITADLNGDGKADLILASSVDDSVNVLFGNGSGPTNSVNLRLSRLTGVSVETQANALGAQNTLASFLTEVNSFAGTLGAFVSRIETAREALSIRRENYLAAASQISDVDVAEKSVRLVKARVLQEAGAISRRWK